MHKNTDEVQEFDDPKNLPGMHLTEFRLELGLPFWRYEIDDLVLEKSLMMVHQQNAVHDGLIPNLFPEGQEKGLYHTADATLWFFHAVDRYLKATHDHATLLMLLPILRDIIQHHLRGTHFGIGVDLKDGLLRQGAESYQLTWMDAKVEDWVVTPRRGKAVEINALWYNALRLFEGWLSGEKQEDEADAIAEHAKRAYDSFNERFWYADAFPAN